MHFNGIELTSPDRVDVVLAPLMVIVMAAGTLFFLGNGVFSWSLIGAFAGGVVSRTLGIRARHSVKEAWAAGLFGAFGGSAGMMAFFLLM